MLIHKYIYKENLILRATINAPVTNVMNEISEILNIQESLAPSQAISVTLHLAQPLSTLFELVIWVDI